MNPIVVICLQIPIYNILFGGSLVIKCNNSHILKNKSILLLLLNIFGEGKPPHTTPTHNL